MSCVSLQALHEALSGRLPNIPFETIQALDVVMRHLPSMRLMAILSIYPHKRELHPSAHAHRCFNMYCCLQVHPSRTFVLHSFWGLLQPPRRRKRSLVWFPSVCSTIPLEDDAQHWWWVCTDINSWIFEMFLHYPSANIYVKCVSVSATAFYKAQPVIEFMCEVLDFKSIEEQQKPLTDSQRVKFTKEIKGDLLEWLVTVTFYGINFCDNLNFGFVSQVWRLK